MEKNERQQHTWISSPLSHKLMSSLIASSEILLTYTSENLKYQNTVMKFFTYQNVNKQMPEPGLKPSSH